MTEVINPFLNFINTLENQTLAGGLLYVGTVSKDPEQVQNRQTIQLKVQGNTPVFVEQPLTLGANGVVLYQGSPAEIMLGSGSYSVLIIKDGKRIYYAPDIITTQTNVIADWSNATNYQASKSLVVGSDGVGYFALQDSGPSSTAVDPTMDTQRVHWNPYANLKDTLIESGSVNDLTKAGTYRVHGLGVSNKPLLLGDFFITVHFINNTSVIQNGWSISAGDTRFWSRSLTGTTWSSWSTVDKLVLPNDAAFPSGAAISLATSLSSFTAKGGINTDGSFSIGNVLINYGSHLFDTSKTITFHRRYTNNFYVVNCTNVFGSGDVGASYTDPTLTGIQLHNESGGSGNIRIDYMVIGELLT